MAKHYKANAMFVVGENTYKPGDDVPVIDNCVAEKWLSIGYIVEYTAPGDLAQAPGADTNNDVAKKIKPRGQRSKP